KPQVIEDQQHERVFERVAAVDVAKAPGMACTRMPNPSRPGTRHSTVWEVPAAMNAVLALAGRLAADGIGMGTLGSTADYWRIWVLRAGKRRAGGAAGHRQPGQEPARAAQNRPAGCDVAGPADRDGDAASLVRAAGAGPGAAGLRPGAHPPGPGPGP